jgi:hypothetical protein
VLAYVLIISAKLQRLERKLATLSTSDSAERQ